MSSNTLYLLIPVLFNFLFSLAVVRWASEEIWGEYVILLVIVNLVAHVLKWGNKDYLLKSFSQFPETMVSLWTDFFYTRLLLLPIGFLAILYFSPASTFINNLLLIWLFNLFLFYAYEPLIYFKKSFVFCAITEFFYAAFVLGILGFFYHSIDAILLVQIIVVATFLKAIAYMTYFWKDVHPFRSFRIRLNLFKDSFSFFLLGLLGLLHAKIDFYCVAYMMEKSQIGVYHILIGLIMRSNLGVNFLIGPFIKYLYRLPQKSLKKLTKKLTLAGLGIIPLWLVAVAFVIKYIYNLEIPSIVYVMGFFMLLPIYMYSVKIINLYRHHHQSKVVTINIIGLLINLFLNILLIPKFGFVGAFGATTIGQLFLLLAYSLLEKKYVR